ncbi:hypothetical protein L195_g036337 [Trifolium pratense]|uniref:DUF3730 domain-containing protein n=1 Tax=Trifolium pratense TaxID=57577 RepID=A0A2K3LP74_TRIPR|nr:hypothetical protein L195_g036337 [Trifolium pratense]
MTPTSLAASIRYVCHKTPDKGVDLILTVSSCIECQDPIIKALGLQSLAHLCEADVIGKHLSSAKVGVPWMQKHIQKHQRACNAI